jgi:hypothetical protein
LCSKSTVSARLETGINEEVPKKLPEKRNNSLKNELDLSKSKLKVGMIT